MKLYKKTSDQDNYFEPVDFTEFEQAVKPVMEWLAKNMHPHAKIIIEMDRAELVEGVRSIVTDEFVPD